MIIANKARSPRGFRDADGKVIVLAVGESRPAKIDDKAMAAILRSGNFTIEETPGDSDVNADAEFYAQFDLDELKTEAKKLGVEFGSRIGKAKLIELLLRPKNDVPNANRS